MSVFGNFMSSIFGGAAAAGPASASPAPANRAAASPAAASPVANRPAAASAAAANPTTASSTAASPQPGTGAPAAAGRQGGVATSAPPQVDIAAVMDKLAEASPEDLNWRKSIVDLRKLLKLDSSLAEQATCHRAPLHREHERFCGDERLAAQAGHGQARRKRRQSAIGAQALAWSSQDRLGLLRIGLGRGAVRTPAPPLFFLFFPRRRRTRLCRSQAARLGGERRRATATRQRPTKPLAGWGVLGIAAPAPPGFPPARLQPGPPGPPAPSKVDRYARDPLFWP
jgi:Domain of unknown function (DUF3597)